MSPTDNSSDNANGPTVVQDDRFVVRFTRPFDPENPLDWPNERKWAVTNVLSATGFNRIMVSTMIAPALIPISRELNMSSTEAAMAMSIYALATALGPLALGPLSELYGREILLHVSNIWFLIWNVASGFAHNKATMIAARFFAGLGASAITSLGGGVMSDVWTADQRGRSLGIYLLIPLLGAAMGPILGGFITGRTTWRWMFWATSLLQVVLAGISKIFFRETYGPVILQRRAQRLRTDQKDPRYLTELETSHTIHSPLHIVWRALSRPMRLLCTHPIIQISSALAAFNYGIMYIVLSTFSDLWVTQYGQSVEISGLHYLAMTIGELCSCLLGGWLIDRMYREKQAKPVPENRIPLAFPGTWITWLAMLGYGWTARAKVHWAVVDTFVAMMMFGMQLGGLPLGAYVIDAYGDYTSSALAAQQFVKSVTAFLFPLFAPNMYIALGYGWTNTTLALLGLFISTPMIAVLWKWGARLRRKASRVE